MTGSATPSSLTRLRQRGDVLLDREALDLALRRLVELDVEHRIIDVDSRFHDQFGHPATHEFVGPVAVIDVIESDDQPAVRPYRDRPLTKLLLSQQRAEIPGIALLRLPDRPGEIHLHQEVHTATQIETEIHRQRAQPREPARGRRRKVERDHELPVERVFDDVPGLELILPRREPEQEPIRDRGLLRGDAVHLHPVHEPVAQRLVDGRAANRRHLYGRVLAEQVGEREDDSRQERHRDERILPRRILVDHGKSRKGCDGRVWNVLELNPT